MRKLLAIPCAVAVAALAGVSNGQNVSEDFSTDLGTLVTTGFEDNFAAADAPAPTVSGGVVTFTGAGDDGRYYVGTADTDYFASSFVATIDVDLVDGASGADGFFGVGLGDSFEVDGGNGSFGEPSQGPAVWTSLAAGNENVRANDNMTNGLGSNRINGNLLGNDDDFATITLAYDQTANTITFSSSVEGSDVLVLPSDFDLSLAGFDETNAHIFFGGSDNISFDNFTVTPSGGSVLGDFDGDGDVDLADLDQYNGNIGAAATGVLEALDLDDDGTVGANDFEQHYSTLVETSNGGVGTFPGDLNLDGIVDVFGDGFVFLGNVGNAATSWAEGDFNADQQVDIFGDGFLLLNNIGNDNGGAAAAPATSAVPEPGTLSLLALAGIGVVARRRR